VEVTTGPPGQGVGNGVGFAIAERLLAARYNRPGHEVVDHRTWVFAGDGDMMEGVASEASSLAGHLRLAHPARRGRQRSGGDRRCLPGGRRGTRAAQLHPAAHPHCLGRARCPGHLKAHGAALGEDEVRATKEVYGWKRDKHFKVPEGVYERWRVRVGEGLRTRDAWEQRLDAYAQAEPELAAELRAALAGELPSGWDTGLEEAFAEPKKQATRKASQQAIKVIAPRLPMLVGGSAIWPSRT
jgi:transketolase